VFPVDFNGTVLPDGSVFGSCRDISERKKTEKALRESEAHLKAIIETEPECIKILDAQGLLLQMNPAGLEMIEADSFAQVKGTPVLDIVAPEYRDAFAAMHKRVIGGEAMHMEYEVLGLKGGRRLLETHAVPMNEQGQTVHLAVTRDITRRKQMEDQVRQLAFHDPLTNLPNRRLLLDRLAQAMAASKRSGLYCAVMFLDLDKFKILNDTHGHGAGDSLLLAVTDRLKNCVREVDTVSRFGGDEFVVLLNCLTADRAESTAQAAIVAEKIRVTLQEPYMLSIEREGRVDAQVDYHCTVSIGVAIFINHEASPEDILKWADAAMYKAKDAGRNTVQFHESPAP
jgi:diguanylate cyclase (GGDEF)-like protein/PAS domain S-box-containing protein